MSNDIYQQYNIDVTKLKRDYIKKPLKRNVIVGKKHYYELPSYEDLYYLYNVLNIRFCDLQNIFNVNLKTIRSWLQKYKINKLSDNRIKNIEKTNLQKYNTKYYIQTEKFKNKFQNKCIQKYNCKTFVQAHINHLNELQDKIKFINVIKENNFKTVKETANYFNINVSSLNKYITDYNLRYMFDYSQSNSERDIRNYINAFMNTLNNVKILDGKEIDIYIPEKKIGIEFNGNYWHSENKVDKKYHQEKSKIAEEKGIFLYHIFEHEWITKQDKIINQLNNLLGLNSEKIYARKCEIREVRNQEKKQFLDFNHLQGSDNSSVKLGLYYNNELVSLMTFCKPRFNKKYEWELSRFCCKANYSIIGGASKLFNYFIKTYNPTSILSYSDIAKTKGNLYNILGFELSHIAEPNFVWIKGNEVLSRYQCQKHKLLALGYIGSTGVEIMRERGYNRLYDAGNKVWVWNNVIFH